MEIGNVIELIFIASVVVYAFVTRKHINLLKEQNRQLAELINRTNKAYFTMQVKWLETFLHRNSKEKRREDTGDGKCESESTGSTDRSG